MATQGSLGKGGFTKSLYASQLTQWTLISEDWKTAPMTTGMDILVQRAMGPVALATGTVGSTVQDKMKSAYACRRCQEPVGKRFNWECVDAELGAAGERYGV